MEQIVKFQLNLANYSLKFAVVACIASICSCKESTSTNQTSQFNPVGQWNYPVYDKPDSTLSNFSIKFWTPDSVKFLGYLDGHLLDSTNGTWKFQNESLFVSLSECVSYGLGSPNGAANDISMLGHDSCISQIKFSNDGTFMFDNTGKKFKRN
jgi:hypothetical protein